MVLYSWKNKAIKYTPTFILLLLLLYSAESQMRETWSNGNNDNRTHYRSPALWNVAFCPTEGERQRDKGTHTHTRARARARLHARFFAREKKRSSRRPDGSITEFNRTISISSSHPVVRIHETQCVTPRARGTAGGARTLSLSRRIDPSGRGA